MKNFASRNAGNGMDGEENTGQDGRSKLVVLRVPIGNVLIERIMMSCGVPVREKAAKSIGHLSFFSKSDIEQEILPAGGEILRSHLIRFRQFAKKNTMKSTLIYLPGDLIYLINRALSGRVFPSAFYSELVNTEER